MTILITGGTGKTGSRLSKLLHNAGHTVLVASRSGKSPSPGIHGVKFDWFDASTHTNPFTETEKLGISPIIGIYLVPSMTDLDVLKDMKPLIDLGIERGVKKFVLLSASTSQPGDPAMGKVHEYLIQKAPKIDYVVLKPAWFFENFEFQWLPSIRDQNEIPSRGEDGKVPFVSADDIAAAAFKAFTEEPTPNTDWVIIGPELSTYDDVASIFSEVLGRKIVHKRATHEERVAFYISSGLTPEYSGVLSYVETLIAQGVEEAVVKSERKYVGKRYLKEWVEENKALWAPQN
ncbi:hypothetical protein AX16_007081 [Volvariella volvacea WC 439]|nr:hypothetical protein AX16_007081 [Volvariella volvacea WC 439]